MITRTRLEQLKRSIRARITSANSRGIHGEGEGFGACRCKVITCPSHANDCKVLPPFVRQRREWPSLISRIMSVPGRKSNSSEGSLDLRMVQMTACSGCMCRVKQVHQSHSRQKWSHEDVSQSHRTQRRQHAPRRGNQL